MGISINIPIGKSAARQRREAEEAARKRKEEQDRLKAQAEAEAAWKKFQMQAGGMTESMAAAGAATGKPVEELRTVQAVAQAPSALEEMERRRQEEIALNTSGAGPVLPGQTPTGPRSALSTVPPSQHASTAAGIAAQSPQASMESRQKLQGEAEKAWEKFQGDKQGAADEQVMTENFPGTTPELAGLVRRNVIPAAAGGITAPEKPKAEEPTVTNAQLVSLIRQVQTETKEAPIDPAKPILGMQRVPAFPTPEEQMAEAIRRYTATDEFVKMVREDYDDAINAEREAISELRRRVAELTKQIQGQ